MKAKVLRGINAVLAAILGLLGVSCHFGYAEYGSPYATFEMSGIVTDEQDQPLENIEVAVTNRQWRSEAVQPCVVGYTDQNGKYEWRTWGSGGGPDSIDIIVRDTAGVYRADSVSLGVEYDRSGVSKSDHWNMGNAKVQQDFQLKKND